MFSFSLHLRELPRGMVKNAKKSGKLQGVIVKSPGNPEGSTQIVF